MKNKRQNLNNYSHNKNKNLKNTKLIIYIKEYLNQMIL